MKPLIILTMFGLFLLGIVSADFTLMDATTSGNCSQAIPVFDSVDGTDGSNYCEFIHDYDASVETEGEFKWQNYNPTNISLYQNLTWTIWFNETPTGNPLLRFYCNGFANRIDYIMASPTSGNNSYNINMSNDMTTVGTCDLGSIVDVLLYAQNGYLPDDTKVRIYTIDAVNNTISPSDFTSPTITIDLNLSNNVSNWFNWSYSGNATNFTVWYNSSGTWIALLNTTDLLTTEYNHTSLTENTSYQYEVNLTWNTTVMTSTSIFTLTTDANGNVAPDIPTLNNPSNNSAQTEDNFDISFDYTITDPDLNPLTCSLQINDVVNVTNSSISSGSTIYNEITVPPLTGTYNWSVNCSDGQDSSDSGTFFFTTSDDTPDQVVGLTYSANDTVISLSWTQQADADIELYYIYRAENSGGPYSLLNYTINSNHDDSGLIAGQTFYYVVSAKDTGDLYGVNSSELQATTTGASSGLGSPGGGGGGSEPAVVEVEVEVERKFCGDLICDEGENPSNCFTDCPVNVDNIVTCVFDDEIACLYEDAWFTQFLIVVLIVGAIYLGISGDN